MKVPRQCPLVLLPKVGWRESNAFESREVERWEVEQGEKVSRVLLHSIGISEVEVSLNNIKNWSPYLTENTTFIHYKYQFVNVV
jgi:hypothetical protein